MTRVIITPLLIVVGLTAAAGTGIFSFLSHVPIHGPAAQQSSAVSLEDERRLATCYREGCSETLRSPVLGCAWDLVIAKQAEASPADVAEAQADCSTLSERDRRKAEEARDHLLLHLAGRQKA